MKKIYVSVLSDCIQQFDIKLITRCAEVMWSYTCITLYIYIICVVYVMLQLTVINILVMLLDSSCCIND